MAHAPLDGPRRSPAHPVGLVVLCHGVGADGQDLIDLAGALALPGIAFAAPDGPQPYADAPFGRQWFDLADRAPARLAIGADRAVAPLLDYIDAELAQLGLPADAVALLGFSQGAMMALHAGLRRIPRPRAIVAFSGALLADPPAGAATPVLLVHGEADPVVPAAASRDALDRLRRAGIAAEALFVPGLGHGIDPSGLARAATLLRASM